jgi:hypothetical protein
VHAIARYANVAFFPQPPIRPTRREPVRDQRPRRHGRSLLAALRELLVVAESQPAVPALRNYPR